MEFSVLENEKMIQTLHFENEEEGKDALLLNIISSISSDFNCDIEQAKKLAYDMATNGLLIILGEFWEKTGYIRYDTTKNSRIWIWQALF